MLLLRFTRPFDLLYDCHPSHSHEITGHQQVSEKMGEGGAGLSVDPKAMPPVPPLSRASCVARHAMQVAPLATMHAAEADMKPASVRA